MKPKLAKKVSPRSARKRRPIMIGTVDDCAAALNLSRRRINQLVVSDGLPRKSYGVYDLVACLRWYVQYLTRAIENRHKHDTGDTTSAGLRHRTMSIDAEIKQLELAKERELLISREKVKKDFAGVVVEIRTKVRDLSPRIAHEILGEQDLAVVQVKIESELKRFLESLSQFEPDDVELVEQSGKSRVQKARK